MIYYVNRSIFLVRNSKNYHLAKSLLGLNQNVEDLGGKTFGEFLVIPDIVGSTCFYSALDMHH